MDKKVKRNYRKDRSGWVTFKGGRKKVKLRAYISKLSKQLTKIGENSYAVNRDSLILAYEDGGLEGIHTKFTELINKIIESKDAAIDEVREIVKINANG